MKSNTKVVAGIDYSMSCPAITIHIGDSWSYDNCIFHYIVPSKKYDIVIPDKVYAYDLPEWQSQEERFNNISEWAISVLKRYNVKNAYIEGYSFASKGVVFHIGENTGLLKHFLWLNYIEFDVVPPSTIKKFGSGKGNADKMKMNEAFEEETGLGLRTSLLASPGKSPLADIVDSYYIAKYLFNKIS